MRAVRDEEGGSISSLLRCFVFIFEPANVSKVIRTESVMTAYLSWDSDEPNLGVVVAVERVPLERAGVDGVVEQHSALGGFIVPMWVVALVFCVVCGDDGDGGLFLPGSF